MNANLKKLLQNLFALIVLPVLGWYITLGDTEMLSIPNTLLVKAEQLLGYLTSSVQPVFGASWA